MDNLPGELSRQCVALADEISRISKIISQYEIDFRQATIDVKRAQAKAALRLKGTATPSIIKMLMDGDGQVQESQDAEQSSYAMLVCGKAELEGLTARFQAAKKALDMAIEELKAFKGVTR